MIGGKRGGARFKTSAQAGSFGNPHLAVSYCRDTTLPMTACPRFETLQDRKDLVVWFQRFPSARKSSRCSSNTGFDTFAVSCSPRVGSIGPRNPSSVPESRARWRLSQVIFFHVKTASAADVFPSFAISLPDSTSRFAGAFMNSTSPHATSSKRFWKPASLGVSSMSVPLRCIRTSP